VRNIINMGGRNGKVQGKGKRDAVPSKAARGSSTRDSNASSVSMITELLTRKSASYAEGSLTCKRDWHGIAKSVLEGDRKCLAEKFTARDMSIFWPVGPPSMLIMSQPLTSAPTSAPISCFESHFQLSLGCLQNADKPGPQTAFLNYRGFNPANTIITLLWDQVPTFSQSRSGGDALSKWLVPTSSMRFQPAFMRALAS